MEHRCELLICSVFFFFSTVILTVLATDKPCSPVTTKYGFVCKCNDSYCDTITTPKALKTGKFYHYLTSSDSPGFTRSKGKFSDTTQLEPDFSVSNDSTEVYVWLNASTTYQTFKGMGAGLTDTCGRLLQSLTTDTLNNLLESYFGPKGLEYLYMRIAESSSDFSSSYYTHDDVPGDVNLTHWNLTAEDLTMKIPLIKQIKAISSRGLNILASPWFAPGWMKTTNSTFQGYLHTKYHEVWAKYLIKFLQAYKDQGVTIWGMTLGNEVVLSLYFGTDFTMANMIMLPAQQRYWVKKFLGPMIQEAGFGDLKLYALDDARPFLDFSAERLFKDKEFSKYVSGVSVHWYLDWNTTVPQLDWFHKKFPDKSLIYNEASINSGQADYSDDVVALGHWNDASRFILDIYDTFCHWSEMYLDWNMVLNSEGGPISLDGYSLDASIIINTTNGEFYKQPIFYSLGHFSKFIQPGSQRINVKVKQVTNDSYDEECSVYSQQMYNQRVSLNKLKSDKSSIPGNLKVLPTKPPVVPSTAVRVLATINPDGSHTVIVYNPRSEAANLTVTDSKKGTFKYTLQPLSLNTFLYW